MPSRSGTSDRFARLRSTLELQRIRPRWHDSTRPLATIFAGLTVVAATLAAIHVVILSESTAERWNNALLDGLILLGLFMATVFVHRAEASQSFSSKFLDWFFTVISGTMLVGFIGLWIYFGASLGFKAGRGLWIQSTWPAPTEAYTAHVTGSVARTSGKHTTRSPVVKITFANGRTEEFVSAQASAARFQTGENVAVLRRTTSKGETFEVDSALHLWLEKTVMFLLLIVMPVLAARFLPRKRFR